MKQTPKTPQPTNNKNKKPRKISIHALQSLKSKPLNTLHMSRLAESPTTHTFNFRNFTNFRSEQNTPKSISLQNHLNNFNLVQSLFVDEQYVLSKLVERGKELEEEKQRVIGRNQVQYTALVQRMLEMRRICNNKQQEVEKVKEQFKQFEIKQKKMMLNTAKVDANSTNKPKTISIRYKKDPHNQKGKIDVINKKINNYSFLQ